MARALTPVATDRAATPADRRRAARERVTRLFAELQSALAELHAAELETGRDREPVRRASGDGNRMAYRVPEVAKLIGVSVEHVTRAIERRELKAVHMGSALLVLAGDLERYLASLD